jgi:epoxyqueuosine reductase
MTTETATYPIDREISPEDLNTRLASFAREVGFDSCRVAASNSPRYAQHFRNWLCEGEHGEMSYMARGEEKRCDPQKILPGARSMVVLAMNYFQGSRNAVEAPAATGEIARYAWGDDYHDLIANKLDKIDEFLRQFGGQQKCYVDTGLVLERDYAAQAGIGWHSKSTMLIDQRLGTWFFLAVILTTLELTPDEAVPDRCGTCERCIKACPTGAITAPHRLDARRCISYLTIELKGSIPIELRSLIGNRIFGCDDCLNACPWNRFAQVSREAAFFARPSTVGMPLRNYLRLSDEEFRVLFKNSPIKRVKRQGFLRNVCVALGNVGDLSDLRALKRAAADPEPLIAEHAKWAIQQILSRQGISPSSLEGDNNLSQGGGN